MLNSLDYIVAFSALLIYLFIAIYTRKVNTFENFSVANRKIGFWLLFTSVTATCIGPGFTLGFTSQGYQFGYFFAIMSMGYALQIILTGAIITPALRKKFSTNIYSIGDIVAGPNTHNSKAVHFLTGLISFGICIGFVAVLSKAGGSILHSFFKISEPAGIFVITLIITIYSFSGGLLASLYTDFFQFFLFALMLITLGVLMFSSLQLSVDEFFAQANRLTSKGFRSHSLFNTISLFAAFTFGELLLPTIITRILSSKESSTANKSFVTSGLFFVFWLILIFSIGIAGSFQLPNYSGDENLLLDLGKVHFPGIFGLFIVAVLGVIMSSQDSLMNTGASLFTRDILKVYSNAPLSDSKQLIYSKVATILIGVSSFLIALGVQSILQGLVLCYTIWVPTIVVVLLASIFLKKHSKLAAITSITTGGTTAVLWYFYISNKDQEASFEILNGSAIIIGSLVSIASYAIVTLWSKKFTTSDSKLT